MNPLILKIQDPVILRCIEQLQAQITMQTAIMDYIAMMADVEIPEQEDNYVV